MTNPPSTAPDGATADSGVKVEARHTPGPWSVRVVRKSPTKVYTTRHVEAPMMTVCQVHGDAPWTEANARLIAAAPELLEALRSAAAYLGERGQKDDEAWALYSHAIAAIAKATGQ